MQRRLACASIVQPELYLGLDAGGTATTLAWLGEHAPPPSEGVAIQVSELGVHDAAEALCRLLAPLVATMRPAGIVAGLAGAGDPSIRRQLEALVAQRISIPFRATGDIEVAAATALAEGPGVAVWSGTGSFAVARAVTGKLYRAGGRGWLVSDEGSGFDVVRGAAIAALRALDGLGPKTALGEQLVEASKAPSLARLGPTLAALGPRGVARLLPVVLASAEGGDGVATALLEQAGVKLAGLALAAAKAACLGLATAHVACGGGVLAHVEIVRRSLAAGLRARGAQRELELVQAGAANGAARLARALATGEAPLARWLADA
jgi:N-acetylglucosamine kinase-like BadF-type ATPase